MICTDKKGKKSFYLYPRKQETVFRCYNTYVAIDPNGNLTMHGALYKPPRNLEEWKAVTKGKKLQLRKTKGNHRVSLPIAGYLNVSGYPRNWLFLVDSKGDLFNVAEPLNESVFVGKTAVFDAGKGKIDVYFQGEEFSETVKVTVSGKVKGATKSFAFEGYSGKLARYLAGKRKE